MWDESGSGGIWGKEINDDDSFVKVATHNGFVDAGRWVMDELEFYVLSFWNGRLSPGSARKVSHTRRWNWNW